MLKSRSENKQSAMLPIITGALVSLVGYFASDFLLGRVSILSVILLVISPLIGGMIAGYWTRRNSWLMGGWSGVVGVAMYLVPWVVYFGKALIVKPADTAFVLESFRIGARMSGGVGVRIVMAMVLSAVGGLLGEKIRESRKA